MTLRTVSLLATNQFSRICVTETGNVIRDRRINIGRSLFYNWILKYLSIIVVMLALRGVDIGVIRNQYSSLYNSCVHFARMNFALLEINSINWVLQDKLIETIDPDYGVSFTQNHSDLFEKMYQSFRSKEFLIKFDKIIAKNSEFSDFYSNVNYDNDCLLLRNKTINCEDFSTVRDSLLYSYKTLIANFSTTFKTFRQVLITNQNPNPFINDSDIYKTISSILSFPASANKLISHLLRNHRSNEDST